MVRIYLGILALLLAACSNANVSISGLNSAGKPIPATPGFDIGGPVSSVTNGSYTVKGKVDSLKTSSTINGSYIVTGEVVR